MYGYIYMTINILNGKRYIGQHKSDRFVTYYKGSGKLLWKSINKYGIENFAVELLDIANSKDELNSKEIYWIEYYNAVEDPMFYNITRGGEGLTLSGSNHHMYNRNFSVEHRINISNSKIGDRNPMYGKYGIKSPRYGKSHKEKTKNKISNSLKGREGNTKNRVRLTDGYYNVCVDPEDYELFRMYLIAGYYRGITTYKNRMESY